MANDRERKAQEREKLKNIIDQWNANRLDIFWLSEPNEDLEFHGAMRFYFQDAGQKVATKCIRVASTASTTDVIETLIEKFRPDIRMLSIPEYALYEIHENGEERKLKGDERPLLVQLDWHRDDREGRFLLRRMDEKSYISSMDACDNENFKRKLSKREKKEKKKREKRERLKAAEESKPDGIAERLYSELPETSFTRSISNPEAVMRRRRAQILEKKLQQFCQEGGSDAGGTLRIFGESLNKDVPYKTLLLSTKDSASYVVKEILNKYGYDKEDPGQYCLVQTIVSHHTQPENQDFQTNGGIREYILDDDDCPLLIQQQHNRNRGALSFHVRRRPADYQPRKRKKKPKPTKDDLGYRSDDANEKLPYLLELNPDGTESHGPAKKHRLYLNVTEVGSERSSSIGGQYLQLFGPNVQPRHCVIAHTQGIVTVTPSSRDAETYVNNMRIYETTILQNGMVVRFGKLHTFRFVDPLHDQKHGMLPDPRQHPEFIERSRREDQLSLHHHGSYETTFDADGNVETVSTHSRDERLSKKSDDALSHRSLGRESTHGRSSERFEQKRGSDPILPAVLEFWEDGEEAFLSAAISQLDPSQVQFKLSPTYALYMAARYRASTHFRPETTPNDRAHRLTALMNNVAAVMHQVIQDRYRDSSALAFWLANTSELLHFLKQDRHLSAYTLDAQDLLAESVQLAFRSLVTCLQVELQDAMPAFLEDRDDVNEEEGTTAEVLAVLASAMSLLRRCRVNAALTIQMFSQLFHFINMWLFNKVVCETRSNLCTRVWGSRLKRRLGRVEAWAEKQGLELAADCHLSRIVQAAHLLQAPKSNSEDLASISSLCFKLNSLQLQTLLERYQPSEDEPLIPRELIESVVKVAENTADEQARSEGREIKLEEDSDLQLPFLLPEDGYSCDIVRGVPAGLQEFLQPLIQAAYCRLTIQPTSSGYWTIYMSDQDIGRMPSGGRSPSVHSHVDDNSSWKHHEPEVATIRLQKSNNGIGLSIVAAGGVDHDKLGIYIKSVVKGGAADLDGRLQAGDQLLKVDGHSLVGVNQEKAAELMTRTGPVVTLEVAKQAAIYNGLSDLLSKPSPTMQRDITLLQREKAFGVPPCGCESHSSKPTANHSHFQNFPKINSVHLSAKQKSHFSYINQPNRAYSDGGKTFEKNIKAAQLKMQIPGLPSKFTACPYNRTLIKPRSEESLNDFYSDCPCPFCQSHLNKVKDKAKEDRSALYRVRDESEDCPLCLYKKHQILKEKLSQNTFTCAVCKSQRAHKCISSENLSMPCYYLDCKDFCYCCDKNANCSLKCSIAAHSYLDKAEFFKEYNRKVARDIFSLLPYQRSSKFSSTETLCSSGSCPWEISSQTSRPRRMSERDIPTRVMHENRPESRLPTGPGQMMPPRMQGSKSVPSLNSNHDAEPVRVHANGSVRSHEVYNPAYSRTSSTASIPKANDYPDQHSRSKSANNLRQEMPGDPRLQYGNPPDDPNPPPYPGPPETNRPVPHPNVPPHSQPNMHPPPQVPSIPASAIQEERHYQNISVYQQPPPPQQMPAQQPNPYTQHPRSSAQAHPQHPPRILHGSQSSLSRPDPQGLQSPVDRSRPLSTLVSPREQEQYANSMGYPHPNVGPPRSPKGSQHSSVDSHYGPQGYVPPRPLHDQRDFRSADPLRNPENDMRPYPDNVPHPDMNNKPYPMNSQDYNMMHMDPRQRDLLRQEAKMEEMREEVRRREDRERLILQQQQQQQHLQMGRGATWSLPRGPVPSARPPHDYHHGQPTTGHMHPPYPGAPPAPAPKPRPQMYNNPGMERVQRPPGYTHPPENSYDGNVMHAPPPVGARMQHQPPPVVSYRYGPSGYPPRSEDGTEQKVVRPQLMPDPRLNTLPAKPANMSQNSRVAYEMQQLVAGHDKKETSNLLSPSPWEREEKEKLHKQRQEEARRARDEEIRELESRPHLTPQQEDRLRALRLEQEFQRRAEELHGEEEEDDDEEQEGRLRQLRLEEVQRKRELEVAKNAEEKLLREARRRQDEFKAPNMPQQIPNRPSQPPVNHQLLSNNQQHMSNHQTVPNYQMEKLNQIDNSNHQDVPPPLPTSPPPIEPNYQSVYNQKPASMRNQRLNDSHHIQQNSGVGYEKHLEPPAPPARKSSYEITNQMSAIGTGNRYVPSSIRNCDNGAQPHYPKKVSFHDSPVENDCDSNGNHNIETGSSQSYTLDDINEVLATPHNSQNLNTYNPGNTPGVIGSQEVYRDPRQRIEAERTQQVVGNKNPGPEKLTFKEKMKMFAQEVGEQESPKDKMKISRAQREIETNLNGS
ncbi:afadin [Trichonephila inaurata madagascariensis]|uniref:Afadin n=1 Tax=Trichonephila inaurata madagascariensis TaxID=2747483 RepID=A0A8X7CI99_9ARAC|nr:afadin [Trichonephila inaurata madagascariensis]